MTGATPILGHVAPALPEWPSATEYLDFNETPTIKPAPLIDGLLDTGSRFLLGGGSKTFKTWLLCDLALSLSAGGPWLGFQTHLSNVLYVNFELKEYYLQQRFRSIREAKDINIPKNTLFIWNLRGVDFGLDRFITELLDLIDKHSLLTVFVDPFYKLLNPLQDENSQTDMGAVLAKFDAVNKAGVTVILAMHFSKGNQAAKDPADRISGAGTLVRDPDNLITLTKHEDENSQSFTLDFIIRDHPPINPFVIKWQHPLLVRTDLDPKKLKTPITGRPKTSSVEQLCSILSKDEFIKHDDFGRRATLVLNISESTFKRRLDEALDSKLIYWSKVEKAYGLSHQYCTSHSTNNQNETAQHPL